MPHSGTAQVRLQGHVIDQESREPIDAAHVFINHSEIGTITDETGYFELTDIPHNTNLPLVITHLSYESFSTFISTTDNTEFDKTFKLKPRALELKEVKVTARKSRKKKRRLKKFIAAFIGNSKNARHTELLNPDVLRFHVNADRVLEANATDMLHLRNEALGYEIYFLLEKFGYKDGQVSYGGKPYFIELVPEDEKEYEDWQEARNATYKGSLPHFFHALIHDQVEEEGFRTYKAVQNQSEGFTVLGEIDASDLLTYNQPNNIFFLTIPGFLKVDYLREKDERNRSAISQRNVNSHPGKNNRTMQVRESEVVQHHQVSYLYGLSNRIVLDPDGHLLKPEQLLEFGYVADDRIAELLPYDYSSEIYRESNAKLIQQDIPTRNGFLLTNLKIPLDEIHSGGPPRDGIPAIDKPGFIAPQKASFMDEKDYILGVAYNNIVKAYPVHILNWHEVVNDEFSGKPVVVTYCPLCGSGMAFEATIEKKDYSFGVSGLLYNSDVLLYDRETESLWSQIMGTAVSGKASGKKLTYIPTQFTTWGQWKKAHPNTLVLSRETGYERDYDRTAYAQYEESPELMFPVDEQDDRIRAKEKIIGVEINQRYKAYPFSALKKHKKPVTDSWQGKTLQVIYNEESNTATVVGGNGDNVPAVTMYWFAWYAFHPDTEVFQD